MPEMVKPRALSTERLFENLDGVLRKALPSGWRAKLEPAGPAPNYSGTRYVHLALATVLHPDARLEVVSPTSKRIAFLVEIKQHLSPSHYVRFLPLYKQARWLVAAPVIGPRTRAVLTEADINWFDLRGDCRIHADGLFIERLSRVRQTDSSSRDTSRRYVRNLFGGAALRIVRWLLIEPTREWALAEMAKRAHASLGFVSRAFATLERDAYIERKSGGVRLRDFDSLLQAWAAAAPPSDEHLPRVSLGDSEATLAQIRAAAGPPSYALTAEAAAELVAPFARYSRVEMYVEQAKPWEKLLQLAPVSRGANVVLIHPEDPGVFDGAEERRGLRIVSWPQRYVDLYRRGGAAAEAAAFMKERRTAGHR